MEGGGKGTDGRKRVLKGFSKKNQYGRKEGRKEELGREGRVPKEGRNSTVQ